VKNSSKRVYLERIKHLSDNSSFVKSSYAEESFFMVVLAEVLLFFYFNVFAGKY